VNIDTNFSGLDQQAGRKQQCIARQKEPDKEAAFGKYNQCNTNPAVLNDKVDKLKTRYHPI
jgi:hypothetical protein